MHRSWVLLVFVFATIIACSKKGDHQPAGDEPNPTQPVYTIQLGEERQGDKMAVIESYRESVTRELNGPNGPETKTRKKTERYDYVEEILDRPANARQPTKAARKYAVAETGHDGGPFQKRTFAGKTVLIELKGDSYSFTVDGVDLPAGEAARMRDTFGRAARFDATALPKAPVGINQSWNTNPEVAISMAKIFSLDPRLLKPEQCRDFGRLTQVYSNEGKQWGVIVLNDELVFGGQDAVSSIMARVSLEHRIDSPIDGSSSAWHLTIGMNGKMNAKSDKGESVDLSLEALLEETRKRIN